MKAILIYEPDPDLLEIICLALEMRGSKTIGLNDLNTGIMALIQLHDPGLILMDFAYKGECCINWCRQIKCLYPNLPILAVSCNYNIRDRYNGSGFDDCISKPFDLEHLYLTVDRYINRLYQVC